MKTTAEWEQARRNLDEARTRCCCSALTMRWRGPKKLKASLQHIAEAAPLVYVLSESDRVLVRSLRATGIDLVSGETGLSSGVLARVCDTFEILQGKDAPVSRRALTIPVEIPSHSGPGSEVWSVIEALDTNDVIPDHKELAAKQLAYRIFLEGGGIPSLDPAIPCGLSAVTALCLSSLSDAHRALFDVEVPENLKTPLVGMEAIRDAGERLGLESAGAAAYAAYLTRE